MNKQDKYVKSYDMARKMGFYVFGAGIKKYPYHSVLVYPIVDPKIMLASKIDYTGRSGPFYYENGLCGIEYNYIMGGDISEIYSFLLNKWNNLKAFI
jgi:hypothetical protein